MDVVYYPYLPLTERLLVGPWELIPPHDLGEVDAGDASKAELIRGLVGMHVLPDSTITSLGALARFGDGRIGDPFEMRAQQNLSRTLVLGLLESNPDFLLSKDERSGNEGHMAVTSDNAQGWIQPLGDDGYIAIEQGMLASTLIGGLNVLEQEGKIPFPPEVRAPMLGRGLEGDFVNAVYGYLDADTDESRRLGRAIDWLDLAWRNTRSLNVELRIVVLKTAFEVLLDSDQVDELRDRLSELLDGPNVERTDRTWETRGGKKKSASMTDVAWWFMQFTFFRNKIAHGDPVEQQDLDHEDGQGHLWLADARLRQAMTEVVARAGNNELRLDRNERRFRSRLRRAGLDPDTAQRIDGSETEGWRPME